MTKEKIINYAMSTPHNTNEAVLNAIIDQHDKETLDNAGFVKTVNGQGPDEQGNVDVATVVSWDDLEGKPFGEDVKETVLFSTNDFSEWGDDMWVEGEEELPYEEDIDCEVSFSGTIDGVEVNSVKKITSHDGTVEFILDNEAQDFIIFNDGIYYRIMSENISNISGTLTLKGMLKKIKQLDPKFLPDDVLTEQEFTRHKTEIFYYSFSENIFYYDSAMTEEKYMDEVADEINISNRHTILIDENGSEYTVLSVIGSGYGTKLIFVDSDAQIKTIELNYE